MRQKLVESAPRRASMTGLEGVGDLDLGYTGDILVSRTAWCTSVRLPNLT